MALSDIAGVIDCSFSGLLGGGSEGCDFEFENMAGGFAILLPPGVTIPAATDLNRAYVRSLQQAGNAKIYNRIYDIEWVAGENTKETADGSGLSNVTRRAIHGVNIMYNKGLYSQKQFSSVSANNYWSVILGDGEGNLLLAKTVAGDFVGLSTSHLYAMPFTLKNGAVSQKTGLEIEFSNSTQINDRLTWVAATDLDFSPDDIDGVNDIELSIPTAPSDTDTVFGVQAVRKKDGGFNSGVAGTDLRVTKNGATLVHTTDYTIAADSANKKYDITLVAAAATGDVFTVAYYDTGNSSEVIILGTAPNDKAYKSNTASTTTVA